MAVGAIHAVNGAAGNHSTSGDKSNSKNATTSGINNNNNNNNNNNDIHSSSGSVDCSTKLLGFLSFHVLFFAIILVCAFLFLGSLLYPRTVGIYFLLPYYTYTMLLVDRAELNAKSCSNDSHYWAWFNNCDEFPLMRWMRQFLKLQLHAASSEELSLQDTEKSQYILAVFPHGTSADYRILMAGLLKDVFPKSHQNIRSLAASVLFRLPLVRELCLWTGCIDARRSVAHHHLQQGHSLLILPGGEAEQIRTVCGKEHVYVKKRKGFIKLAIEHSVPVVPCYVFGASDLYATSNLAFHARLWLVKNVGIALPLAWGLWFSPFCPQPVPTTVVIGEPLHFKKQKTGKAHHHHPPTAADEVEIAHAEFCHALTTLFDQHKYRLGYGERELEII